MKLKIKFFLLYFFIILCVFLSTGTVKAGMNNVFDDDAYGYAWSSNIGWLKFSCNNTPGSCQDIAYGVDIDIDTGEMSGYAWSSNIGWVDFSGAKVDLDTGEVSGTATVLSWGGTISLSGEAQNGESYGVTFDFDTQKFSGYAWEPENIGWLSFSGSGYAVYGPNLAQSENAPSIPIGLSASDSCSELNKVTVSLEWDESFGTQPITYKIYRGTSINSITEISPGGVSDFNYYDDEGRNQNNQYYYRVKAINNFGESALSEVFSITTQNCVPPSIPSLSVNACDAGSGDISATLSYSSSGSKPITYHVEMDGEEIGSSQINTFTQSGLVSGTSYSFRVYAENAIGFSDYSSERIVGPSYDSCGNAPITSKIQTFRASPSIGNPPYTCTLSWELSAFDSEATRCQIKYGNNTEEVSPIPSGSIPQDINKETRFTLECSEDDFGNISDSKSTTCRINPDYKETK